MAAFVDDDVTFDSSIFYSIKQGVTFEISEEMFWLFWNGETVLYVDSSSEATRWNAFYSSKMMFVKDIILPC